jgi:hypothetical protein
MFRGNTNRLQPMIIAFFNADPGLAPPEKGLGHEGSGSNQAKVFVIDGKDSGRDFSGKPYPLFRVRTSDA